MTEEVTEADLPHLRRCVELATEAVGAGDFPFGSVPRRARPSEVQLARSGSGFALSDERSV